MDKASPISGNAALFILILVNLIPFAGVLAWDWDVSGILVLYWFENVVIGLVCILKILTATGKDEAKAITKNSDNPGMSENTVAEHNGTGARIFLTAFFIFHYGMFCFAHGLFIFMLIDGKVEGFINGGPLALFAKKLPDALDSGGILFVLAIIASHLFSFFHNYIGKGEFRRTSAKAQWIAPYGRVLVLHVAILLGAVVITAVGSPVILLILLIVGKIMLDVKLHIRSHGTLKPS